MESSMSSEIIVPELGESIVEATVGRWLKKEGDTVTAGEPVVTLETEKVNLDVGATQAGILARITRKEGEDVKIGEVLGSIEPAGKGTTPQPKAESPATLAPAKPAPTAKSNGASSEAPTPVPAVHASAPEVSPVAKRVAQDLNVDVASISGTGPGGRVMKEDVQAYAEKQKTERAAPQPAAPKPQSAPTAQTPAPDSNQRTERLPMSRRRRTIAQRLVEAQHTAAMLTTFNEIDMSKVIEIRTRRKESFKERYAVGLGFMSFFVKASIGALKAFSRLNAEIDGDDILLKHYYDIGMAIGAAEGLVVPVLREADRLSFANIEKAIKNFSEKTKSGTLSLDDLRGGTFTITNGGVFGSLLSTPILNTPQVAILGLHKIQERPIALNGQVVIRPMMYVALSYDHRIVDGREAVQFLVKMKELLEDPESLLLEG
jgi:2-oxoglutarate dehydrogenase E2 component (dihydrolipoamide succinyltransferase)